MLSLPAVWCCHMTSIQRNRQGCRMSVGLSRLSEWPIPLRFATSILPARDYWRPPNSCAFRAPLALLTNSAANVVRSSRLVSPSCHRWRGWLLRLSASRYPLPVEAGAHPSTLSDVVHRLRRCGANRGCCSHTGRQAALGLPFA